MKKLSRWYEKQKTEIRQFFFCLLGVFLYKALDLTGEQIDLSGLSIAFVGFAIAIALIFTLLTDNDPLPLRGKDETAAEYQIRIQKIMRRISKNAVIVGFAWQSALSKLEGLIEL